MHQRATVCSLALSAMTLVCTSNLAGAPQATGTPATSGQAAAAQSNASTNTHIYRVSAFRAAPGRIGELEKLLTSPAPSPGAAAGDFAVVFRHRQGSEWDFLTIEHMGQQATIDVRTGPPAQPDSPLSQAIGWHGDTFAAGPPLDEFRRALNLQGGATAGGAGKSGVYTVSDYMAVAGHRGQLRQVLNDIAGETPGRTVTLAHVEGAPWNFLFITRYESWQQFAQEEEASVAQTGKGPNRGLALREHLAIHHDTLVTIQAVSGSAAGR